MTLSCRFELTRISLTSPPSSPAAMHLDWRRLPLRFRRTNPLREESLRFPDRASAFLLPMLAAGAVNVPQKPSGKLHVLRFLESDAPARAASLDGRLEPPC